MIYLDDISFLLGLFVKLLKFGNIFAILYVLLKVFVSEISKYSDAEVESKYEKREKKMLWKIACEEAYYLIQTPCRFSKKNVIELPSKPLTWSCEYKHAPCNMKISNKTGYIFLEAEYYDLLPHLSGGPLDGKYTLQHIVFKLRQRKVKTMTDHKLFALELHAVHFRSDFLTRSKNSERIRINNTGKSAVVIINYVYTFSKEDNFAMEEMLSRFSMIERHDSSCYLNPFPLNWILPKFTEYYYIQQEPQSYLPFADSIQWILSPVRLTISKQQMNTFTKILNPNYAMRLNKKYFDKNDIFLCTEIEEEPK